MTATKTAGAPSAQSIKNIKELQSLPRKPSRGSSTSFSNVDYNFHGNFHDIHHLLQPRRPNGVGAVHQPVPLGQLNFEVGLRSYKPSSDAGHSHAWSGALSTHSLLDPRPEMLLSYGDPPSKKAK